MGLTPGLPDFSWHTIPKGEKMYQIATKLPNAHKCTPNGRNIFRMAIEYTNLSHSKTLQNLPKLGFLVLKYTIWQPCLAHKKFDVRKNWRRKKNSSFRRHRKFHSKTVLFDRVTRFGRIFDQVLQTLGSFFNLQKSPTFSGYFFPRLGLRINFDEKWVGLHFGRLLHELVRSHCFSLSWEWLKNLSRTNFGSASIRARVARLYIFKPKIQIWVNFVGPLTGKCWYILWPIVIYFGHLVYFMAIW
jgi:hypothetical protein